MQNEIFVKLSEKLTVEIKFVVVLCLYVANRQFGHRISHRTWIKYVFEWAAWRRRAVAFEFVEGEGGFRTEDDIMSVSLFPSQPLATQHVIAIVSLHD